MVMYTNPLATLMVLEVVINEGGVMSPHFFPLGFNDADNEEMFESVV